MRLRALRQQWTPTWTIVLVLVLAAGLTAVAARQVTTSLRGDPPPSTLAIDQADQADPAGAIADAAPLPPAVEPGALPEVAADLAPGTGSEPIIGDPVIEEVDREPVPDLVSLQAGTVPDQLAPPPVEAPPEESSGGEGGPLDAPVPGSNQRAPIPRGFGVGIRVETEGHFARITVGVSGGPHGLGAMRIELGGGERYELSASQVEQLRDGGTFVLVHRYEPTLTPQPQRARVLATDRTPTDRTAFVEFETQAEFLLGFSPLRVTALEDCDFWAGKNDFELAWNLDGRTSSSRFDLDKGESYVEEGFRRGANGVRYGGGYRYFLEIRELDGADAWLEPWTWEFPAEFRGASGGAGPKIVDLGTHRYPVTLFYRASGKDLCRVRFDYSYTVALADRPPRA